MKREFGYAIRRESDVYHLFDFRSSCTLCGLPASLTTRLEPVSLRVVKLLPQKVRLCRHCDDAADQDDFVFSDLTD